MKCKYINVLTFALVMVFMAKLIMHTDAHSISIDLKKSLKGISGAIVSNQTNSPVKVSQWNSFSMLPALHSSRDVGICDVDTILISKKTSINGKEYANGVLRICDFSSVLITENKGIQKFKTSNTHHLCELLGNGGWYKNINDAFAEGK